MDIINVGQKIGDLLATLQTTVGAVTALCIAAAVFFVVLGIVKWLRLDEKYREKRLDAIEQGWHKEQKDKWAKKEWARREALARRKRLNGW